MLKLDAGRGGQREHLKPLAVHADLELLAPRK